MSVPAVALAALLLAGCGGAASGSTAGGEKPPRPEVSLRMTVHDGKGGKRKATLTCRAASSATGFLRDVPGRHCRTARRLARFLAAAPDPHRACTEIYGGPQTARVKGRIGESAIDRRFHRSDGCGIADWHRARDLLGSDPRGPEPPG
jgi:hypothetical protein